MKKIIIIIISLLSISLFPFFNAYAYTDEYEIENYNVEIKVNENHVLNITEEIEANFKVSKHGIKRNIPTKNTYKRNINNEEVEIESDAKISNIDINEQFTKENRYTELQLTIGNPDKTITGLKKYVIKYDYDMGEDYINDIDDLYYNIIGTNWDCNIKNVTFKIVMPKAFDETKINFTIGRYGATYNSDIKYNIENNIISGYVEKRYGYALSAYEGLTVKIELDEGYYINENEYKWYNNPNSNYYYFDNYDVNASLKENNTMHVDEKYTITYNDDYNTFYRKIRKSGYIEKYIDGKYKKQYIDYKISNVKSNIQISHYDDGEYYTIYFNNHDEKLKDKSYEYTLSYDIDFCDDFDTTSDLFLYDFKESYAPVKDFHLKLNMPKPIYKEVIENKIKILTSDNNFNYTNKELSNRRINIEYEDNSFDITLKKNYFGYSLDSYEDFIIKITLEEGYFTNETIIKNKIENKMNIRIIIICIMFIITTIIYFLFGFRKAKNTVVYYNSPEDLSPAEVGYIYKGKVKNKHIISLIIYFANKGYLKITTKKRDFELEKLKPISITEPEYAKVTFSGLFPRGNKTTKSNLKNQFYITLDVAKRKLKNEHDIYSKSHKMSILIYILMIIAYLIILLIEKSFKNNYIFTDSMAYKHDIMIYLIWIFILIDIIYIKFSKKMKKESTTLYSKIIGFRDFLKKVEKEKLELLVEENPNYFYEILPYAYVLGISRKWSKKFEGIDVRKSEFYSKDIISGTTLDTMSFTRSISSMMHTATAVSSSRPYESSSYSGGGSFSSGGGSSGGGGGGGGGSSW